MIRRILALSLAVTFVIGAIVQSAAAQEDQYRVVIATCFDPPLNPETPPEIECGPAEGITFTLTDANTGAVFSSCVSAQQPPSMGTGCEALVPYGAEVRVTGDAAAVPADYIPGDNPVFITAPPAPNDEGPAVVRFTYVLQTGAPPVVQPGDPHDLPIQVVNCPEAPSDPFGPLPVDVCDSGPGISFTVTDANTGEVYGSCESATLENYNYAECRVTVPVGSTVVVTEDTSTVPAGYAPFENPVTREVSEAAIRAGEGAYAPFINVLQTAPPAGAEPTPAPPPQLPDTGTGSTGLRQLISFFG